MPIGQPAPPPARGTRKKESTSTTYSPRTAARSEALQGWATMGQMGLLMRGWYADSAAVGMHAPAICTEIARMGETNEKLGQQLDLLVKAGPYTQILSAAMPLILQFLVNHGRLEAAHVQQFGIKPPAVLEASIKAEMAEMAAQALREQREAENRLQELQKEFQGQNGQVAHATN